MVPAKPDLRLNRRERALVEEISRVTLLDEWDLCRVAGRKLLNLWDRTPEYPLLRSPADRAILTENLRNLARKLPRLSESSCDSGPVHGWSPLGRKRSRRSELTILALPIRYRCSFGRLRIEV